MLATDATPNRRLAIAGLGITLSFESLVRDAIQRGQLVSVLKEFCAPFPGYHQYYPQRRQAPRPLRALVDYVRRAKHVRRMKQTVISPMTEERAAR